MCTYFIDFPHVHNFVIRAVLEMTIFNMCKITCLCYFAPYFVDFPDVQSHMILLIRAMR